AKRHLRERDRTIRHENQMIMQRPTTTTVWPAVSVLRLDTAEVLDLDLAPAAVLQWRRLTTTQRRDEIVLPFSVTSGPSRNLQLGLRTRTRFARRPLPIALRMIPPLAVRSIRRRRKRDNERLLLLNPNKSLVRNLAHSPPIPTSTRLAERRLIRLARHR